MSKLSDFWPTGSGTPLRVVSYTTGTGTFTPLVDQSRCMVRLQAGGQGGQTGQGLIGGGGGQAGAFVEVFIRVPIAGLTYAVGAGSANANSYGSPTSLGAFSAGPSVTRAGSTPPAGGPGGTSDGSTYATTGGTGSSFGGPAGGAGGPANGNTQGGGGGGGSSFFGTGGSGTTGVGGAGTGYGAGGAGGRGASAGGAGSGGYIEIWEFGA